MARRLSEEKRQQILVELSTNKTQPQIAKKVGCSLKTIEAVAKHYRELNKAGEGKPARDLKRMVNQRVSELDLELRREFLDSDEIVENAVEQAALDRVEVITRHKAEWNAHKPIIDALVNDTVVEDQRMAAERANGSLDADGIKMFAAFTALRKERAIVAKSTAETIKTRQESERRLYGLDLGSEGEDRPFKSMSENELTKRLGDTMRRLAAEGLLNEEELEGMLK